MRAGADPGRGRKKKEEASNLLFLYGTKIYFADFLVLLSNSVIRTTIAAFLLGACWILPPVTLESSLTFICFALMDLIIFPSIVNGVDFLLSSSLYVTTL